jgi:hypothetical protein
MKNSLSRSIGAASAVLFTVLLVSCSNGGGGPVPPRPSTGSAANALHALTAPHFPTYALAARFPNFTPVKINDNGVIVGVDISKARGVEYKDGRLTYLPPLAGDTESAATGVNNRDEIVGYSVNPQRMRGCLIPPYQHCRPEHALLYRNGVPADLGSVPAERGVPSFLNEADVINDRGEIAGESGHPHSLAGLADLTIFAPGGVHAISVRGITIYGAPSGLNDSGEIVGYAELPWVKAVEAVFSYPDKIECSPHILVANGDISAINNKGDTISYSASGAPDDYCRSGVAQHIPFWAYALNNNGDIVGFADPPQSAVYSGGMFSKSSEIDAAHAKLGSYHLSENAASGYVVPVNYGDAMLYSGGSVYDLNTLVPNHPGFTLQSAVSINDRGEIVGYTIDQSGNLTGYLLTPVSVGP